MKIRVCLKVVLISVLILFINATNCYAKITKPNISIYKNSFELATSKAHETILADLKVQYNYTPPRDNVLEDKIKIKTIFQIIKVRDDNTYDIQLGGNGKKFTKIDWDSLINVYGYDKENQDDVDEYEAWPVVIICSVNQSMDEGVNSGDTNITPRTNYEIIGEELYSGDDYSRGEAIELETSEIYDYTYTPDELVEDVVSMIEDVVSIKEKIIFAIFDGLKTLGDVLIMIANSVQTITNETVLDRAVAYNYEILKRDANGTYATKGSGKRDMYTNVGTYKKNDGKDNGWQKVMNLDNSVEGFNKEKTEIPVIVADLYNLGLGNINFLDVNFLRADTTMHSQKSIWMQIRNIFSLILHIIIYLASASLIASLIYHGIHVVRGAIDNPGEQAEHREGLRRFFVAVLMLVGSIIIMAICLNANKMFFDIVKMKDSSGQITNEFPIRVNVKNAYSFSTNITGYLRFMCEIDDVKLLGEKILYTVCYLFMVICNCIAVGLMIFRVLVLVLYGAIGPIIAALYGWNKEMPNMNYANWAKTYVKWASVQIVFAMVSRFILETALFTGGV